MRASYLKYLYVIILSISLSACSKENIYSPDLKNPKLLPQLSDYESKDYGTQALAKEVAGNYMADINIVIYDQKTRRIPLLYLTRGNHIIHIEAQKDGSVEVSYTKFHTIIMPLQMNFKIKALLSRKKDSIMLRGSDGSVRTEAAKNMEIGVPLPESDDAELEGAFIRKSDSLGLLINLNLPIAIKAWVKASKIK